MCALKHFHIWFIFFVDVYIKGKGVNDGQLYRYQSPLCPTHNDKTCQEVQITQRDNLFSFFRIVILSADTLKGIYRP